MFSTFGFNSGLVVGADGEQVFAQSLVLQVTKVIGPASGDCLLTLSNVTSGAATALSSTSSGKFLEYFDRTGKFAFNNGSAVGALP